MITFPINITVETNEQLFTVAIDNGFVYNTEATPEENFTNAVEFAKNAGQQMIVQWIARPFNREIDLQAIAYAKAKKEEVKQLAEQAVEVGEVITEE